MVQSFHSPIHVACIGDSITWGYAMTNCIDEFYPAQLQRILGDGYDVRNFGDSGSRVDSNPDSDAQKDCSAVIFRGIIGSRAYGTANANSDTEAALKGYSVHPAHVEVANTKVRPFTQTRLCLDYEV